MALMSGTALSKTDNIAKTTPRSVTGKSLEIIERIAEAVIGPKHDIVAPMYMKSVDCAKTKNIRPAACDTDPIIIKTVSGHFRSLVFNGILMSIIRTKVRDWYVRNQL